MINDALSKSSKDPKIPREVAGTANRISHRRIQRSPREVVADTCKAVASEDGALAAKDEAAKESSRQRSYTKRS